MLLAEELGAVVGSHYPFLGLCGKAMLGRVVKLLFA